MQSKWKILRAGISSLSLIVAADALAQGQTGEVAQNDQAIETSEEVVVQGHIGFRNRSDSTEPTLVYDYDYFQRFEPLTAGDALKRVPSVTFLSDVIESDGPRLRGLDPGYTQILINGERVPGSNVDRSFFLDRIPAELIKQVEIVRSSSARRTGDAVAGTLNIVLRDGYQLDGGYVRGGGLFFDDGEVKPSAGLVFGGALGPGRILLGANLQGRYNPKKKQSFRYSDSPENNPDYATQDFDNREDQTDIRNGTDYAFNGSYTIDSASTDFVLSGHYVRTDRTESERSYEYDDPTANSGPAGGGGSLLTDNANVNQIDQENYSISGKLSQNWVAGKTTLRLGYARFHDHQDETEVEIDFDRAAPRVTGDLTLTRIKDAELSAGIDHEIALGSGINFVAGGFYQDKDRETDISTVRQRFNLAAGLQDSYDQFEDNPDGLANAYGATAPVVGGLNRIEETRKDLFALVEGKGGILAWEAGVRWENTDVRLYDRQIAGAAGAQSNHYDFLLPSASLKFDLSGGNRVTLSGARTVRRPRLDYVSPALLEAELGDNDLLGNSDLRPESSWGVDLGFEHRMGRMGVAGVNLFYRDVTNLIEIANTGVEGSEGAGTFVLQPRNAGNGKVYGVEFDLSTDLGFIGLNDTGVFGNFSWLDSEITDSFGKRRFNSQSETIFNVGFIQNIPSVGAAFGASYRKQGSAFGRTVGEEVTTTYGADLEVFVEKRFGKSFTIRAVGSNLLDGAKSETFNKFTTLADQVSRDFDEYELERETAGPVFQVMARFAF